MCVERAILLDGHSVLSAYEKDNCVGLYLDYCGSPSKQTAFNDLYMRLPKLVACAITVAKRQPNNAFGCNKRRKLAAPPEHEFERLLEFNHDKVFCDMYVRRKTEKPCDPILKKKPMKPEKPINQKNNQVSGTATHWKSRGNPGSGFDGVKRMDNRLIFRINKTYHRKCALCAIMLDDSQHTTTERFWLTAKQAHALLLV